MKNDFKKKLKTVWLWVRPIVITCAVVLAAKSSLADWYYVPTGSMKPTIVEGDRLFVNKLAYGLEVPFSSWRIATWSKPSRGEIIVFYPPQSRQCFVKRVVGMPGDTIAMFDNAVYLNGEELPYERLSDDQVDQITQEERDNHVFFEEDLDGTEHAVMFQPGSRALKTFGPITIPQGHYFVMGDNRDNSSDSRYWGFVSQGRVVGRANRVIISFDRNHYYLPRLGRFFRSLDG